MLEYDDAVRRRLERELGNGGGKDATYVEAEDLRSVLAHLDELPGAGKLEAEAYEEGKAEGFASAAREAGDSAADLYAKLLGYEVPAELEDVLTAILGKVSDLCDQLNALEPGN